MPPEMLAPQPVQPDMPLQGLAPIDLAALFPELAQMGDPFTASAAIAPPGPRAPHVSLELTPDQQSRLLAQLREHYDEAIEGRDEQEWRRALRYRRYLADPTLRDGMQPWTDAPQVFTANTRDTLERLKDEMIDELLPDYERVVLTGIGDEDAAPARKKQAFFRWALERLNKFRTVLNEWNQDALLDGLGIVKVYPSRMTFDGWLDAAEQQQFGALLTLLQTTIAMETVDQGTLLIPPDAMGLQYPEARYIGQILYPHTIDDFPDMRQRGFLLKDAPDAYTETDGYQDVGERKRLELSRDRLDPQTWYRGRVEMVEQYERFDVNGDGIREFIVAHWFPEGTYGDADMGGQLTRILLLKDALPQRQFPRPMWPYFPLRYWRQQRQLRGLALPDRIEWCQDVLNRLIEQCLQHGEINMLPFFFYNAALTGALPDLTEVRPGQGVPIVQGGSVTFKPNNSANQHYAELINLVTGYIEADSNVNAANQGRSSQAPNQPRTVGGLALLLQEGNKAKAEMAKEGAEQVTEALQFAMALWQTHVPSTMEIPLPNTEAIEQRLLQGQSATDVPLQMTQVTAQELDGMFDLSLKINPNALLEQQKQLTLAEQLDPKLAEYPIGRRLLWKNCCEQLGMKEFDKYWPEEVARIQTMISVLQKDAILGQLEMQLAQLAGLGLQPPPESQALLSGQAGQPQAPALAPGMQGAQGLHGVVQALQQLLPPGQGGASGGTTALATVAPLLRATAGANTGGQELVQGG